MTIEQNGSAYDGLDPETILAAIESAGYRCNGQVSALNSYENRVYQIGLEHDKPLIAKFYRPARWTKEAIQEEHDFTLELNEHEIPVICPLQNSSGETLFNYHEFLFCLYPTAGGRAPELDDPEHLVILGRCLARIHNVAATKPFAYRPQLDIQSYAIEPKQYLIEHDFIPADLLEAYDSVTDYLIKKITSGFEAIGKPDNIRLHGDCHLGNILWFDEAPFIVDFDDARSGPAVQDLWMFLSGDRQYMTARLHDLLSGYIEFRDFPGNELSLIEPLRTLRMIHYSGWLARRWTDPAFPVAFPWFNTQRYWEEQVLSLKEQLALMDDPPLEWLPDSF